MTDPDFAHTDPTYEANTLKGISRPPYVAVPHLEPVQRARTLGVDDPTLPRNARSLARRAARRGWSVRVTHAHGYDSDAEGPKQIAVKELTGELTPTGRDATKEIGSTLAPPVHSFRVVIQTPENILVGHWCPGWDHGMILEGHRLVAVVNWSGLNEAMTNAESRADLRGETPDGQLPLQGDGGESL